MPIEAALLKDAPYPEVKCPLCGVFPVEPTMRGQVQRRDWGLVIEWRHFDIGPLRFDYPKPYIKHRPYCAIICSNCMQVIGYEAPSEDDLRRYEKREAERKRTTPKPTPTIIVDADGRERWEGDITDYSSSAMIDSTETGSTGLGFSDAIEQFRREAEWKRQQKRDDDFSNSGCS